MRKQRNYKNEYQKRLAAGFARGLSRSQARGHARAGEKPLRSGQPKRSKEMEAAVREMNRGASLTLAAKLSHVSRERLARYVRDQGVGKSDGRKWTMSDKRPRGIVILSDGKVLTPIVRTFADASLGGSYWNAKSEFLRTNDIKFLAPYRGLGVRDSKGRFIPFETDPNEVLRLGSTSLPVFYEVYERTV